MALALTRKPGERFFIGDDIAVEVVGIDRGGILIAITAPRSVEILREELVRAGDERLNIGRPAARHDLGGEA